MPASSKIYSLQIQLPLFSRKLASHNSMRKKDDMVGKKLRGSLPKSGPLDFATKNTFALFFVSEEALVGVY